MTSYIRAELLGGPFDGQNSLVPVGSYMAYPERSHTHVYLPCADGKWRYAPTCDEILRYRTVVVSLIEEGGPELGRSIGRLVYDIHHSPYDSSKVMVAKTQTNAPERFMADLVEWRH